MTPRRRFFSGLVLLLIFGGALAALAPFTLGRAVLDLDGTEVRGTVTNKYLGHYWNRFAGNKRSHRVVVAFRTADHRDLSADRSVSVRTYAAAALGASLDVVYWPPLPQLSAVEPTPWDDPLFLGLFALALVLLWLSVMILVRAFVPPRSRAREGIAVDH